MQEAVLQSENPYNGLDAYARTLSDTFVPLETSVATSSGFAGAVIGMALGPLEVARVEATPHVVRRLPGKIEGDAPGFFKVNVQISGTSRIVQDGRSAVLAPGDLALYDTTRPFELVFDEDFHVLAMMFPRPLLHLPVPGIDDLTARRISGSSGLGALVSPYVRHIEQVAAGATRTAVEHLQISVVQLLAAVFAAELRPGELVLETPRKALLSHAQSFICNNLSERLDLQTIAGALHVSVRHLQKLFEEEGTTVSTWVRSRRLEHCCTDLSDPELDNVPVHAVGGRWGFGDPAHFSRVFKSHLGMTPTEYRQQSAARKYE